MKYKIILVSKANTDEGLIREKLLSANLHVTSTFTSEQAMKTIEKGGHDLVVFNLKNFDQKKLELSKKLRIDGHTVPLMVLSESADLDSLNAINKISRTVVLQKPFTDKELIGLAKKMIATTEITQQIDKRYPTNQIARLEVYPTGEAHQSHIFNLSKTGAYMEVPLEANFNQGDLIKINIRLAKINKNHNVHAKVVWTNENASWNQGKAVGIRFMNKDEVYSHMLDNL